MVPESAFLPAVAVGATDLLGTQLFKGHYIVATKTFGAMKNLEVSVGRGTKRPDGMFGGIRWGSPQMPNWAFVAEYDAINYKRDYRANETGAIVRSEEAGGRRRISLGLAWGAGRRASAIISAQTLTFRFRSPSASSFRNCTNRRPSIPSRRRRASRSRNGSSRPVAAALVQALHQAGFQERPRDDRQDAQAVADQ
ncbi:YjbH domain-containing protein [Massilia phosphatilytica]